MSPAPSSDLPDELFRTAWLAARLREGDTARFQELYDRVAPALFAWARLRLQPPLRSQLDPQDLLQEIWFRALHRFEHYRPEAGSFRAWIFGIGRTTLLEAFRKLSAARELRSAQESSCFRPLEGLPDSATSIRSRLAADEAVQRFVAYAEGISHEDRHILVLCGLEGVSCRETGSLVGLSEEAVTKRWQRLRAQLREKRWSHELLGDSTGAARD